MWTKEHLLESSPQDRWVGDAVNSFLQRKILYLQSNFGWGGLQRLNEVLLTDILEIENEPDIMKTKLTYIPKDLWDFVSPARKN